MKKLFLFFIFFIATLHAAIPTYQAKGTARSGTGAVTPTWPVHQVGDVALLFIESAGGETVTLSSAAGFAQLPNSPQYSGTTTSGTRITVFWARATSTTMSNPTVADAGNHVNAQILTYRGVTATGNPWDATSGGNKSPASTTVTVPGVTTTSADELIVQVSAKDIDSNQAGFSNYTNSNLSNITERTDIGTTSGNGGGFSAWDGGKALAGATGNTTATVRSSINAYMTIALKPDVAISLATCGTEDFTEYNSNVPLTANWNIITATNYTPNVQSGRLILSNATPAISTAITLRGSLPASNNYLEITFQSFAFGGNGADGMTVTLSDAAITPVAGAFGGSLGYAQKSNPGSDCTTPGGCPGFAGGWLGFGLDEYGNFSNPTEGRIGGPGARADSFSIRGNANAGYPYIAGTATLSPGIDNTSGTLANPLPGYYYRLSIDTRNSSTFLKAERDTGSGFTTILPWTDATQVAAAPANYLLSLTASTGANVNYHVADNFTLKALSCGTVQIIPPSIRGQFDAWDTFRSITDRNISTKIVGKSFDLNISSLNSSRNAMQDYNGTVCVRLTNLADQNITGWTKLLFSNVKSIPVTMTLNRAIGGSDSAIVDLHWQNNSDTTCPLALETDTAHSTDRFSVRPNAFTITTPNAVAGTDFNITFLASNFTSTASNDYNATVGNSFDVTYTEHNISCPLGSFNTPINSGWSFANGTKTLTTHYSEVGVVDMNISDTSKPCASRYANIDCDDANVPGFYTALTDLSIGTTQAQVTIKPHHFDLNATLFNSGSGPFTYLSTDLNMSSKLDINVSAKNEQNVTTLNYDKGCYAKTTTLNLPHSIVPSPLNTILLHENLSKIDSNITKTNPISFSFAKAIWTQGSAPLSVLINFDRDRSNPMNPFDFNISNATLTDSDTVTGTVVPQGTATFVYGRARAYDIKTDQPTAPNPIELEIYSRIPTIYISGMPQNVLYWYRNMNHSALSQGSILSGDDYTSTLKTGVSATITINSSSAPSSGQHLILINNPDAISHAVVHLAVPSWLWHSTLNNYDFSSSTTCLQHPCFDYQYFGTSTPNLTGVNSGTYQGSDFILTPAKTIIKKGVKVFR